MRPREAAVMPLPSEEVTPPVTNTNFGTGWTSGVFSMIQRWRCSVQDGLNTSLEPQQTAGRATSDWSGDGEGKTVQNDEAGSIARGVRRIGWDLDRLIAAAIVQVSIESQTAESRIAELPVLEPGVLD